MRLFSRTKTVNESIQEIHNAFNNEGEKLLVEAKKILSGLVITEKEQDLSNRLGRMGFWSSKIVTEVAKKQDEIKKKKEVAELITKYNTYYPQSRFIDEAGVKRLCEKYNLLQGDIRNYIGSVPEENLVHIENFKVRKEDQVYQRNVTFISFDSVPKEITYIEYMTELRAHELREFSVSNDRRKAIGVEINTDFPVETTWKSGFRGHTYAYNVLFNPLTICAPKKDFTLGIRDKVEGYKIVTIPDPIVLHKVQGGYLIVTAWGLEASDDLVMNPKHN